MAYAPLTTGLKFQIRIRDLEGRDVMIVICPACGWTTRLAPHVHYDKYLDHTRLVEVERDLLCRQCGVKGKLRWHLERATGPGHLRLADIRQGPPE